MSFSVPLIKWASWVRASVVEIEKAWPAFSTGTYPGHDPDEAHAADYMVPAWQTSAGRAKGQKLADQLAKVSFLKPRGMWYVIFYGRIWSMTRPGSGWLPYFDRNSTNPSRSHHNHVHVSWYKNQPAGLHLPVQVIKPEDQPRAYSAGWVPDKPWVFYLDRQDIGQKDSDSVWLIQKALGVKPRDGHYTVTLRDQVKEWQRNDLKDEAKFCDGILGRRQAQALFNDAVDIEDHA
jgi:hypothetical protein